MQLEDYTIGVLLQWPCALNVGFLVQKCKKWSLLGYLGIALNTVSFLIGDWMHIWILIQVFVVLNNAEFKDVSLLIVNIQITHIGVQIDAEILGKQS